MFFQFSPIRRKSEPKVLKKENESEKIETLSLAPFTHNPKLFFEDVKIGTTVTRKLLIDNPTSQDIHIFLSHNFPQELNVTLSWSENTVPRDKNVVLEITWCPLKEESARHIISIHGKKLQRDVPVAFKSLLPKKSKTGTRPKKYKPEITSFKHTSPIQRKSPTKRYYSSRPPNISPKKYSPSQKRNSPTTRKYSASPGKRPVVIISGQCSPTKLQNKSYTESPKSRSVFKGDSMIKLMKENIPMSFLNTSGDNNIFVSPASATFHLDYLQPIERRETYVVNGKDKSPESFFSDSLENISSPKMSPSPENSQSSVHAKLPLGLSTRDNISVTPSTYGFQYKLMQLESFSFTPMSTPVKQTKEFSPALSATIERHLNKKSPEVTVTQLFPDKNSTYEIKNSPNISTETYVKSNLSAETYVKGNVSFETYVKGNLSSGTYTKDSSVGDVANLSLSPIVTKMPISPKQPQNQAYGPSGDTARNVIESNLWTRSLRPLTSIKEESYIHQSMTESDISQRSFLKRKSNFDISVTPNKRASITSGPKEWSKKGGAAFRIAKRTTGLNLKQIVNNSTIENAKSDNDITVLTKKDTNTLIIQNPFLLAATNLVDPFMTPHLQISEEWLDQQQIDFKKWLNALLTPPDELNFEEQVVDVAKVWQECKKREVEAAPTKEEVSSKYHTNSKLNALRKSAQNLFRSKELCTALSKVVLAVETGKLAIREDKDIHLNLLLKSEIMSMLLSYNPLWLRIGLETIYNEIIPLKSNSDIMGLSTFIATRLLKDPYLLKKHKSVHSPKYIADFKKFFLKKFFVLVYFLDQAKNRKLIGHDPCLFCKRAMVKESKEMLIKLARDMLAAVGDITKYLRHIDYVVTHTQTYIHEFDYAVKNLGVDLRDGVRLTKVMEIILLKDDLTSNLRVPAISRLQKIHNMKIVFDSLEKAGYAILYDISPKDIVDGHKEKTLSFLWQIIYKFQAPLMVKSATTIQTWFRSLPVILKRRKLERERLRRENAAKKIQAWYKRQKLSEKLLEFVKLLEIYIKTVKRERAAIKIQSFYRMHRLRKIYMLVYMTVVNIQKMAKGWLVRNVYRERIKKAVIIQKNVRMFLARKRYLNLKKATNVIQKQYRATRQMKKERYAYNELRTTVTFVQRKYRAKLLATRAKNSYEELKWAANCIQQRFRANKLSRIEHHRYVETKRAVVCIQTWYRSLVAMKVCRQEYVNLKNSVITIEERFLALKLMRVEKNNYQLLRCSCISIQQWYRGCRQMKIERKAYLDLRASATVIQRRYRATREMKKEERYYKTLKSVTIFIQRKFRANKSMKLLRSSYVQLKNATLKIQRWFRATVEMKRCRTHYSALKNAVLICEARYEAKKLMETQRNNYLSLRSATISIQTRYRSLVVMRKIRADYTQLKEATVFIQGKFRANKLAVEQRQHYLKLQKAALVVQRRYRAQREMRLARERFLKLKRASVAVQRRFRANVSMKVARNYYQKLLQATVIMQRRFRAVKAMHIARENYIKLRKAAIFVQRTWRARVLGKYHRQRYTELKNATVIIQRRWRASKQAQKEREQYLVMKKSTLYIQRIWRAKKLGIRERTQYLQIRKSVLVLEQRWRAKKIGELQLQKYRGLKAATVLIQRIWRANKLMRLERDNYQRLKNAVVVVQSRWRANKLATKERKSYVALKNAVLVTQHRWRAKKQGEQQRRSYQELKRATIRIQRQWRANQIGKFEREKYVKLKEAVCVIQKRWRANKLAELERKNYLHMRNSAIVLQQRWKAKKLRQLHFREYEELRKVTIFIQRKWRANKLSRRERTRYQLIKHSVGVVQSRWRAKKLAEKQRTSFLRLKNAAVVIQQRWRAKKMGRQQLESYIKLRKTVIYIQTKWRANRMTKFESNRYQTLKRTVSLLKNRWKANREANRERKIFLEVKTAVITIQNRWRAIKIGRQCLKMYTELKQAVLLIQRTWRLKKLRERDRNNFIAIRRAVICVQRKWIAQRQMRIAVANYKILKFAVYTVQSRFRANMLMRQQRQVYINIRTSVIRIQRHYRGYLKMKKERAEFEVKKRVVVILQRYVRGYLIRRKYAHYFTAEAREERRIALIRNKSATKIQAIWRGHRTRSIETPELLNIRQRAKKANALAETQNTLESRCRLGLQALVNEKSTVFMINKALEDLDFITRHSGKTCTQVAQFLPEQMFLMIKTTNRSLPEMMACLFSIKILININKYEPTRPYSFIPDYLDNIITLMLHWCDKDAQLFPSICTLLWLFAHNPKWKRFIKSLPNIQQRFSKIKMQVSRKDSMVKRTGVKGHSVFAPFKNLPLPSLDADWGLEYKNKPYVFTNSVHAFSSLLSILEM